MLGKLLKYEFGATGRIFLPMYGALLAMSLVARVFFTSGLHSNMATVLITLVLVMLFTAVWVVTLVIIVRRFWSNLLGREGYLMNVLPVNPWEHVFTKSVTSCVWIIAGTVVSVAAFLVMLFGLPELTELDLREVFEDFNEVITYLRDESLAGQTVLAIVLFALLMIVSSLEFPLLAYGSMCVGQLANRRRVWASIGAYFGLNIAQSFVTRLVTESYNGLGHFAISPAMPAEEYARWALIGTNRFLALMLLLNLAVSAALFFLCSILLKKKLNLQ